MTDPYGLLASGLPPELAAQYQGLTRQQAIAQALMQQAQQPLDVPESKGRFQGRTSPLAGIAKVVQAMAGQYAASQGDKGMADLGARAQQNMMDTIAKSQEARTGTPDQTFPQPAMSDEGEGNTPLPPAVKAGTPANSAVANALLMNNPLTRDIGKQMMQRDMDMQIVKSAMGGGTATPGVPGAPGTPAASMKGAPPLELLAGGPMGTAVYKALEERSKGIAARPGAPVVNPYTGEVIAQPTPAVPPNVQLTIGPNGPTAAPVPGAIQAASDVVAATTTAKEKAEAPFEMVEVKMADGRTVKVPKSSLLGAAPPTASQPLSASPVASLTVTEPSRAPKATPMPFSPPTVGGEPYAPPVPAQSAWSTIPKRVVPQGMGQSTFDEGLQKQQADRVATLSKELGDKAQAASQKTMLNNQALEMVDKADTGTGAAFLGDIKNLMVSRFGVPESDFENSPSATIALGKDLTQAATAKAKAQFGPKITQGEVNLMLQRGSPNTDMPTAAIKFLLHSDNASNQFDIQQANDFGKYIQSGGDPMRFEGWYSQNFPMTKAVEGVKLDTSPQRRASDKTTLRFDAKGNQIP